MDGKSWECSSCNEDQKISRNCSLEIEENEIEYEDDNRFIHVGQNLKNESKFGITIDKFRFHICPVNIVSYESNQILRTFFMCEKFACLPYAGSFLEQDNKTTEAFEIINTEINRHENSELEKSKKEMNKK